MRNAFCTDVHCPKFRSFFHSFLCCMLIKNCAPPMFEFQLSDYSTESMIAEPQVNSYRWLGYTRARIASPTAIYSIQYKRKRTENFHNCIIYHLWKGIGIVRMHIVCGYIRFIWLLHNWWGLLHSICIEFTQSQRIQQTTPLYPPSTKYNLRDFIFTRN